NSLGLIVARYAYDPYGNTLSISGSKAALNPYRFSSKEQHDRSGFFHYGYRWYVPEVQRWVNRDPLGDLMHIKRSRSQFFRYELPLDIQQSPIEKTQGPNLYK